MKVERARENVFRLTLTAPELSALAGAARMTLDAMRAEPAAPRDAIALLERLLREYDAAVARLGAERGAGKEDGRLGRPS